jgi:uncharacterized membrane protein
MNPDQTSANQSTNTPAPAIHKNTAMAILSYLGPLVIISFAVAKQDPFVKYHIKQGLVLFVIEIIIWILGMFFFPSYFLWMILRLANLCTLILSIIGIIYAAKGEEKGLPVVGSFSKHFKF